MGVHPRGRGEAQAQRNLATAPLGPSPRARGSRAGLRPQAELARFIPAGAGMNRAVRPSPHAARVHPRGRGEAPDARASATIDSGPSPRARGSPDPRGCRLVTVRSIPAGAGKPPNTSTPSTTRRVHPRGRGEASVEIDAVIGQLGPSPRARGSRPGRRQAPRASGSIPAGAGRLHGAGKPSPCRMRCSCRTVHPRGRGEAAMEAPAPRLRLGPSPRARGSLELRGHAGPEGGSIPAGAGKPCTTRTRCRASRVHPRGRGEAQWPEFLGKFSEGPSPRARGSLPLALPPPS